MRRSPEAARRKDRSSEEGRHRLGPVLVVLACLAGLAATWDGLNNLSLPAMCRVAVLVSVLGIASVIRADPRASWSCTGVYLIVFWIFHLGLVALLAVNGVPNVATPEDLVWIHRASFPRTILIVTAALMMCCLGALLTMLSGQRWSAPRDVFEHSEDPDEPHPQSAFGVAGFVIVVSAVLAWFALTLGAGGPSLLVAPYLDFLAATAGLPYSDVYFAFGLGAVLLAAAPPSGARRLGMCVFVLFCAVALPLGLRSEVLFPAAAAAAVAAKRRIPFTALQSVALALVLLSLTAAIRQLRDVGLEGVQQAAVTINPLAGVAELGGSIRPVAEVVHWHDDLQEPFLGGGGYMAPIARPIEATAGLSRLPATSDVRLFNVAIQTRIGPIGGSPVAEAYHNFGLAGALLAMFLIGIVLGRLDRTNATPGSQAIAGVLLLPLLTQVRNDFTPVPFQVVLGAIVVITLTALPPARAVVLERERKRWRAR